MIGLSSRPLQLTPAQLRTNAAWIRDRLAILMPWLDSNPDRWPPWRTAVALRAIHAGDERWRERAAEVRR